MKRAPFAIFALFTLAIVAPSHAQDGTGGTPLFSMDRASLGVTTNYAFYQAVGDEPLPTFRKEWEFGAVGAYNLVAQPGGKAPLLSATYSINYGVDNRMWRHRIGLTLTLWKGSDR